MAGWCAGPLPVWADGAAPSPQQSDPSQAQSTSANTTSKSASGKETQLKEVVVSGYAASLEKAIEDKFDAPNITDGISAESIGQFPEQNLAESLQRVTGVQITRNQGEGQYISVRGLDPKFTDTLYNGRQLPSGSGTRAFDFQVLSGDFASRVDVYKSPTADLPESGLAATVNVQSIRPLDYGQEKAVATVEGAYDQQARSGVTPHLQALYTNTFMDQRLGWLVAFDLNERNVDSQSAGSDGVSPDQTAAGQYRIYGGLGTNDQVGFDRRISAMSMLQFKVNDHLELRVDTLDSEFDQAYNWSEGNGFYPGAFASGPETTLSETVAPDGVETAWEGTNVFGYVQANRFAYRQKLTSNALAATLNLQNWKIDAEGSFGQARETTTNMYVGWEPAGTSPTFYYNTNEDAGGPIGIGFVGYNQNDVNNYKFLGQQGEYQAPTTDKIWNFKLDATHPLDFWWVDTFKVGVNYEDRTLANSPNWISNTTNGFGSNMNPYLELYSNQTFFSSYSGPAHFPTTWLTPNLNKLYANYPLSTFATENPPTPTLASTTVVQEKSSAAYGQITLASPNGRWTGNLGVRAVHTEELSSGYVPSSDAILLYGVGGGSSLVTYSSQGIQAISNSYDNVLPDLNITYKLTDGLLARLAAAQVMQRPDMNLLGEASSPAVSTGPPAAGYEWIGTLNEGNPDLRPYLSNQFDLSLEWYFGPRSLLAGDFFLKDVRNLILTSYYTQTQNVKLAGNLLNDTTHTIGEVLPVLFNVTQPTNAQATTLKGVEFAWQQPFDFLPRFLDALGAEANYTHIWTTNVVVNEGQPAEPITGVSNNTYNAGLYYDNGKFQVHANYNYRSEWVSDPVSFFGDGLYVKGYGQLDLSGNYNLTKWLSIEASVINATQSPLIEIDRYGISRLYELDGRRFYLGVHAVL
jgi:TonB-dependent receptor